MNLTSNILSVTTGKKMRKQRTNLSNFGKQALPRILRLRTNRSTQTL